MSKFENRIHAVVTEEVNEAFAPLLKEGARLDQSEALKLQQMILRTLHSITEEATAEIICGLLAHANAKHTIPFYSLKKDEKA